MKKQIDFASLKFDKQERSKKQKPKEKFSREEYDAFSSSDPIGLEILIKNGDMIVNKMSEGIIGESSYDAIQNIDFEPWNNEESEKEETFQDFMKKIEGNDDKSFKNKSGGICSKKIHEEYLENYEFF